MVGFESANLYRDFMALPERAQELFWEYKYKFLVKYENDIVQYLDEWLADINKHCESPIEKIMWLALIIKTEPIISTNEGDLYYNIVPQAEIGDYRVDFLISTYMYKKDLDDEISEDIIVECDGHDFHERTKEQVSRANNRDYELKKMGYDILHFSGSDIFKDPIHCATKTVEYIVTEIERKILERRKTNERSQESSKYRVLE